METVKVEVDDRLVLVTIDRPEVRNALSRQVLAELRERDGVGIVGFTGAGGKASGADISQRRHYGLHTGVDAEMQRTCTTADEAEGASAFLEKRPPAFTGV